MDKDGARAYRRRWLAVNEFEKTEAPAVSMELRWRQLNAAFGLGKSVHLVADDPDEMRVYLRWAKLKRNQPQHPKV